MYSLFSSLWNVLMKYASYVLTVSRCFPKVIYKVNSSSKIGVNFSQLLIETALTRCLKTADYFKKYEKLKFDNLWFFLNLNHSAWLLILLLINNLLWLVTPLPSNPCTVKRGKHWAQWLFINKSGLAQRLAVICRWQGRPGFSLKIRLHLHWFARWQVLTRSVVPLSEP